MDTACILSRTIRKIEAAKKYFEVSLQSIEKYAEMSMSSNLLGYLISQYPIIVNMPSTANQFKESFLSEFSKFVDVVKEEKSDVEYRYSFVLKGEGLKFEKNNMLDFESAAKEYEMASVMASTHCSNALMMIIVIYEQYIASIFQMLIEKYPNKYLANRQMKYSEIIERDLGGIKSEMIQREVDALMYKEYSDWFVIMQEHGIKIPLDDDTLEDLKEAYYRRNIIVHNNSVVNCQYRIGVQNTRYSGARIGDVLVTDNKYLQHIFDVITITVFAIAIALTKLENAEDSSKLMGRIFDMGYMRMQRHEWKISEFIFRNTKIQKCLDSEMRSMALVNYWISMINEDGYESVEAEIRDCDFSAHDIKFSIAKKTLLREYDDVIRMLGKVFPNIISVNVLETWPLFFDFRESDQYIEFKNEHSDQHKVREYARAREKDAGVSEKEQKDCEEELIKESDCGRDV